jgi:CspA family cold shock protein
MSEREVEKGTVVWFNDKRGIGFIKPDDGGKDYFVHYTNIISEPDKFKTLTAGQRVSFCVGANKNGPQAEEIVPEELE